MFAFHLSHLPSGTIAHEIFEAQKVSNKGLFAEVNPHLDEIGIVSLNGVTKSQFKQQCKKHIFLKNKQTLLELAPGNKKINFQEFQNDYFERKSYFFHLDLEKVRYRYRQ